MNQADTPSTESKGPRSPNPSRNWRVDFESVLPWKNTITLFGLFLVAVAACLLLTFGLFSVFNPASNPYFDIVGFMVLPGVFVVGLVICPIGVVVRRWRNRRAGSPRVMSSRSALVFLGTSFFLVLPILGMSGYEGYHYTESTQFCAKVCHAVMEPQASTYQHSPHARVSCAQCHIGSGASYFVKSKLSGVRQVLAVLGDTFSRPIPPAITALRPAQYTCEQCHWPQKFFGNQLKSITHFSPDEQNTRREVHVLLKTGGADDTLGRREGIHMHMLAPIEYVAGDDLLQEIPWVRYVDMTGHEHIYRSDGKPASSPPPPGLVRKLDCMDCHNRAAHSFRPPDEAVDLQLDVKRIDATLPFIKREAVAALSHPFPDKPTAHAEIERAIRDFYRQSYPQVWEQRADAVNQAIETIQGIYARNFFPEMKADWRTYPNNIGHRNSPGCLRCHDGLHVNESTRTLSSDCNICHTFFNEPRDGNGLVEGEFDHALRIHNRWDGLGPHSQLRCNQCHTGGPLPLCGSCHQSGEWL
ncbi:MAG: NapC/NirT family cytochrome c, partial [Phycisphaerae bacterium]